MAQRVQAGDRAAAHPGWADLSPISFLLRAARSFPERVAVRHEDRPYTHAEHLARASALAGVLQAHGVKTGERVAVLLPNVPEMLEAHYAAPGIGAAIVPLNTRLSAPEIGRILGHCGARCLITNVTGAELARTGGLAPEEVPAIIPIGPEYEAALSAARPVDLAPQPEAALLSINYTSGTTGQPKGVMYTHRGAFLQAMGMIAESRLSSRSRYLWTLPRCSTATDGRSPGPSPRRAPSTSAWPSSPVRGRGG